MSPRPTVAVCQVAGAALIALLTVMVHAGGVMAGEPRGTTIRVSGGNRFETVVGLSEYGFDRAEAVVLTVADDPNVASVSAPLAARLGGPVLLIPPGLLPPVVKDEIARLDPSLVLLVVRGPTIDQGLTDDLHALGREVQVVQEPDLAGVATAIAERLTESSRVYLTSGLDPTRWIDTLLAARMAAEDESPILLTTADGLIPEAAASLTANPPQEVVLVGDVTSLSAAAARQVEALGISTRRIAGDDIYATAVEAAKRSCASGPTFVGSSVNSADVSAAPAVAAARCGQLLLTEPRDPALSPVTLQALAERSPADLVVIGGTATISDRATTQLATAAGSAVARLKGFNDPRTSGGDVLVLFLGAAVTVAGLVRRPSIGQQTDTQPQRAPNQ